MTATERERRAAEADTLCRRAYEDTGLPEVGVALVAVGGYGRGELAPFSDLDVVLVHDTDADPGEAAGRLWYPLWDSGASIDHAVRTPEGCLEAAAADLRVALGLLDLRHLAGDPHLTLRLRTTLLAAWRRDVKVRLPELHATVRARVERMGELAHASVPDLKESAGGLRDATVLKALVATWLVDVPHTDLERCRSQLLDVRDVVHAEAGRATDRIAPEHWDGIARALGLEAAVDAQQHVRALGRRMTHLSRLTWRRVDALLARPAPRPGVRRPRLERLGHGVAIDDGVEIVLDRGARPDLDPTLLLRAAAEAAERGLVLAPPTAARLARSSADLPDPWPSEARDLLVRLLAAGDGLLPVWETLDETGALSRLLPEWERIRLLPHASVVHRFTVDRHVVETCIEASRLIRRVPRPDLLVLSALLHDIGKGGLTEHCVAGEPIAREVGRRMGLDQADVDQVALMVRWHLLLSETATTRDPEDPATVASVLEHVPTLADLELLRQLTEADARATSPQAWTGWRASLIDTLTARCRAALDPDGSGPVGADGEGGTRRSRSWRRRRPTASADAAPPGLVRMPGPGATALAVDATEDGQRVTVAAPDRVGLLADVAAVLALQRVEVRSARAWSMDQHGVSVWEVEDAGLDAGVLRQRLDAITAGRVDPGERLSRPVPARLEPAVSVHTDASESATVLEVRMDDRPGVVYLVASAVATLGMSVRSAHIATWGPQAVDVFYLQESGAGALGEERAAAAAHAVRTALRAAVRLDPG